MVGKGAVVAGLAAWSIPEILTATPAEAAGISAPPTSPGGGGSGEGGGGSVGVGGTGGVSGSTSGGASGGAQVSASASVQPGTAAAGTSSDSNPLAFTGFDAEVAAAAGAALVSSGWLITRWVSRHRPPAASSPESPAGSQGPR